VSTHTYYSTNKQRHWGSKCRLICLCVCHACERVMKVALAGSCMNPAEVVLQGKIPWICKTPLKLTTLAFPTMKTGQTTQVVPQSLHKSPIVPFAEPPVLQALSTRPQGWGLRVTQTSYLRPSLRGQGFWLLFWCWASVAPGNRRHYTASLAVPLCHNVFQLKNHHLFDGLVSSLANILAEERLQGIHAAFKGGR